MGASWILIALVAAAAAAVVVLAFLPLMSTQAEAEDLASSIAKLRTEMDERQKELEKVKATVGGLSSTLSSTELQALTEKLAALQKEIDELKRRIADAEQRLAAAKAEIERIEGRLSEIDASNAKLNAEFSALTDKLVEQNEALKAAGAATAEALARRDATKAQLEAITTQLSLAEQERNTLNEQLQILTAVQKNLTEKLALMSQDADETRKKLLALTEEAARLQGVVVEKEAELAKANAELEAARTSGELDSQVAALDSQIKAATETKDALQQQTLQLKQIRDTLTTELKGAEQARIEIEQRQATAVETSKAAQVALDEARQKTLEATASLGTLAAASQETLDSQQVLQAKIAEVQEQLRKAEEAKVALDSEITKIQAVNDTLKGELSAATLAKEEALKKGDALTAQISTLQTDLKTKTDQIAASRVRLAQLQTEIGSLDQQKTEIQTQLDAAKSQQTLSLATVEALQQKKQLISEELAKRTAEFQAASEEKARLTGLINDTQTQLNSGQIKLDDAISKLQAELTKGSDLQTKFGSAQTALAEAKKQLETAQLQESRLQQQKVELEKTDAQTQQQLTDAQRQAAEAATRVENLTVDLNKKQADLDALNQTAQAALKTTQETEAQVAAVSSTLTEALQARDLVNATLKTLEEQKAALEAEIAAAQPKLEELKQLQAKAVELTSTLSTTTSQLQQAAADLQTAIQQKQTTEQIAAASQRQVDAVKDAVRDLEAVADAIKAQQAAEAKMNQWQVYRRRTEPWPTFNHGEGWRYFDSDREVWGGFSTSEGGGYGLATNPGSNSATAVSSPGDNCADNYNGTCPNGWMFLGPMEVDGRTVNICSDASGGQNPASCVQYRTRSNGFVFKENSKTAWFNTEPTEAARGESWNRCRVQWSNCAKLNPGEIAPIGFDANDAAARAIKTVPANENLCTSSTNIILKPVNNATFSASMKMVRPPGIAGNFELQYIMASPSQTDGNSLFTLANLRAAGHGGYAWDFPRASVRMSGNTVVYVNLSSGKKNSSVGASITGIPDGQSVEVMYQMCNGLSFWVVRSATGSNFTCTIDGQSTTLTSSWLTLEKSAVYLGWYGVNNGSVIPGKPAVHAIAINLKTVTSSNWTEPEAVSHPWGSAWETGPNAFRFTADACPWDIVRPVTTATQQ